MVLLSLLSSPFIQVAAAEPVEASAPADPAAVSNALRSTVEGLDAAVSEARLLLQGLDSVQSNYSQYRDTKVLDERLRLAKNGVLNANALVPEATRLQAAFAANFPPEARKAAFGNDAGAVEILADSLTERLQAWSRARLQAARRVNDSATEDLEQARSMFAQPAMKTSAVGHMEMWVIGYHGVMLEAVDLIFPAPEGPDAPPLLPEELAEKERAADLRKQVAAVGDQVAEIKAAAAAAAKKRIAEARFPAGAAPADPAVKAVLEKEYGPVLKQAVHTDWTTREEARWVGGGWVVDTYRYLTVWIAAKTPAGKHRVYLTQVRSKKEGGGWGPIRYRGVSDSYEILPANL